MNMRKATAQKSSANRDAIIIREAVIYAQAMAAHENGFAADPNGTKDIAANLGDRHWRIAQSALQKLTQTPARSSEAVEAKARIVPIVLDSYKNSDIDDEARTFFRAFAADMRRILEPITHEHWLGKLKHERQKKVA
jgi:hypothetical protein